VLLTLCGWCVVPEGFLDAMVTALAAKHDLLAKNRPVNSRTGRLSF
jgi:hypothetical protein